MYTMANMHFAHVFTTKEVNANNRVIYLLHANFLKLVYVVYAFFFK